MSSWHCGSMLVYYTRGWGFKYTFFAKIISTDSVDSLEFILGKLEYTLTVLELVGISKLCGTADEVCFWM